MRATIAIALSSWRELTRRWGLWAALLLAGLTLASVVYAAHDRPAFMAPVSVTSAIANVSAYYVTLWVGLSLPLLLAPIVAGGIRRSRSGGPLRLAGVSGRSAWAAWAYGIGGALFAAPLLGAPLACFVVMCVRMGMITFGGQWIETVVQWIETVVVFWLFISAITCIGAAAGLMTRGSWVAMVLRAWLLEALATAVAVGGAAAMLGVVRCDARCDAEDVFLLALFFAALFAHLMIAVAARVSAQESLV